MFRFVSPAPTMFSGLDTLQPRHVERPSAEEQYFQRLAEEHERAAALARKRLTDVRRQRQQQQALEAQLALQQQLATAFHAPQRPSYHPTRRAPQSLADIILGFGADNERESYAEYMHRQTQERQKRVEQQAAMRALFEQQRRAEAERVAELQRRRALEAKAQQERQLKAQEEARRQQAARAADEEKIRQFFQALMGAVAQEGADLERKNAIRRNSAPAQEKPKDVPVPAPAPKSAPVSPKVPERAASPAPSVASDASDASLNSIAHLQDKYDTLRSNFTFPATLVFAPSTSSPNASPSLLYNPTNAPVHAYEHALTNLLTELDAVESFGDSHVRDVRRSLARSVEAELEALEVKKRDAWRSQAVKVEVEAPVAVESAPVESAPVESAPVESAPVEVESTPAPVAESAPVESTPATESAPAPESAPVDPVEFLATRLAVPTESEDDEVKAVRENLLASLTTEPAPVSTEADKDEVVPKDEPVTESESAADNATELEATPATETETETTTSTEAEPVTETAPTETESEPVVESAPEPEVADAHTPTATPEIVVSVPEPVTVAPEPEVTPASPVESVASSSEPEVVHHEVEPTVAVQPEPESVAQPESDSAASTVPESAPVLPEPEPTVAAAHPEPESVTQPEPEHSAFVKVYPDSESDSESDLASELAERKSTAGDEFELL